MQIFKEEQTLAENNGQSNLSSCKNSLRTNGFPSPLASE